MLTCRDCGKSEDQPNVKFYKAPNNKRCAKCQNAYATKCSADRRQRGQFRVSRPLKNKAQEAQEDPSGLSGADEPSATSEDPFSASEEPQEPVAVKSITSGPKRRKTITPHQNEVQAEKPTQIGISETVGLPSRRPDPGPLPRLPLSTIPLTALPAAEPKPTTTLAPGWVPGQVRPLGSPKNQRVLLSEFHRLESKIHGLQVKLQNFYRERLQLAQSCSHQWADGADAIGIDPYLDRPRCRVCQLFV